MTLNECVKAQVSCEPVQLDGKGAMGHVANITKKGLVQVRYPGDRRPRIGVAPERLFLVK